MIRNLMLAAGLFAFTSTAALAAPATVRATTHKVAKQDPAGGGTTDTKDAKKAKGKSKKSKKAAKDGDKAADSDKAPAPPAPAPAK
jgi:hypothetical protein